MTYTVIAYKSDATETCRGYVMKSYSSEFIYETGHTRESAVARLADKDSSGSVLNMSALRRN